MNDYIEGRRPGRIEDTPAKPHPTDYLKMRPGSQHLLEDLYDARDEVGANCVGHEDTFVDYEVPPSDEAAKTLCRDCPVFELCKAYAEQGHPAFGVWAGRVFGRDLDVD